MHAAVKRARNNMRGAAAYRCSEGCRRWSGKSIHLGSSHWSSLHVIVDQAHVSEEPEKLSVPLS